MPENVAASLNEKMKERYALRCRSEIGNFPTIVDLADGKLILRSDGKREVLTNRHRDEIDLIKNVAHLPLLNYLLCEGPEDEITQQLFASSLSALEEQIHRTISKQEDRGLLLAIVRGIAPHAGEASALFSQGNTVGQLLKQAIYRGAQLRLEGMHEILSRWAQEMNETAWASLRVVITSSHAARRDNLSEQFFLWAFGEKARPRVLIAEGIEDEEAAVDCFGAQLVDSKLGKLFFADAGYLHRDVLASPVPSLLRDLAPILRRSAT